MLPIYQPIDLTLTHTLVLTAPQTLGVYVRWLKGALRALASIELGDPCVFSRSLPISDAYPGSNCPTDIRCLCTTVEGRTFVHRLDGTMTVDRPIHVYSVTVPVGACRSMCMSCQSLPIHVYVLSIGSLQIHVYVLSGGAFEKSHHTIFQSKRRHFRLFSTWNAKVESVSVSRPRRRNKGKF